MRRNLASSCLAVCSLFGALSEVLAASVYPAPQVIGGIGPDQAYAAPVFAAPAPQRASASPLGGGFIELLANGLTPQAGPSPFDPPAVRRPQPRGSYGSPTPQMTYASPNQPAMTMPRRVMDARFLRQDVAYDGSEAPGTIVVDTPNRFLYLVQGDGRATRYGIGVGRPGFAWAGVKTITRKAEWPGWTPPPEMVLRRPDLPRHMEGGPENPLGARALYLGSSLYRIHGTNEPETIGTNVSSGCIRMMNEDVTDLYERVRVGTRVIVI